MTVRRCHKTALHSHDFPHLGERLRDIAGSRSRPTLRLTGAPVAHDTEASADSHASVLCQSAVALPPKGGLLAIDKPTTLPCYEYRDKFFGTKWRVLRLSAGAAVVARG